MLVSGGEQREGMIVVAKLCLDMIAWLNFVGFHGCGVHMQTDFLPVLVPHQIVIVRGQLLLANSMALRDPNITSL
jgi:hypothetical protein